jgi:[ribulose-bisphosphate carboxylase]/[fructose-bisphosphate aldolase]-lysine N-methyltransferase
MRLLMIVPTLVLLSLSSNAFTNTRHHSTFLMVGRQSPIRLFASPVDALIEALKTAEVTKTCKVTIGPSPTAGRFGLIATSNIKPGETVLAVPYDDMFCLTPTLARTVVFRDKLPEGYDGWTGDTGLIALLLLNEVARAADQGGGIALPRRTPAMQSFLQAWVTSLPSPKEMEHEHPYMWSEEDQEVLQSSSTNKIYRRLDDMDEDATWLEERLWSKDRTTFPQTVEWNGETIPCFTAQGFKWAMILATSRTFFTDGCLRLTPVLDFVNHDDTKGREVEGGTMGTFGTTRGAVLVSGAMYKAGEEVFCSYGPKSAADYLLEHGFCPPKVWKTAVSELTFELDPDDRFYDDKMDILEFETYDQAPMDPVQSFDVVSDIGRDGEPDQAMVQFVRLCKLGGTDAFLLESIFRKEVWGFMALPVSEQNELQVVTAIVDACQKALDDLATCPTGGPEICMQLRDAETKALTKTMEFLRREREALDLKEYYQERRLKDLGLDSDWSPEDDIVDPELGFGQTRVPGGADYDW